MKIFCSTIEVRRIYIGDPNDRPDRSNCQAPIAILSSEVCLIQFNARPEAVTPGWFSVSSASSEVFTSENVGDQKMLARILV